MTLDMRLVPNPADGFVQAMSDRTGRELGFVRNCFDISCVVLALIIGWVWAHEVIGIGLGTVVSAIGAGRVITAYHIILEKVKRRREQNGSRPKKGRKCRIV